MPSINPYLTFEGNCEEAFEFYRSVFGGEFAFMGRFSEMPEGDHQVSDDEQNLVMHVSLPIGEDSVLMGSDTSKSFTPKIAQGNNFSISIQADTKEDADSYFDKLTEGGKITMPMDSTFWGSYFGMLTDRFGIHWMISFDEQGENS